MRANKLHRQHGFTLVELAVVLVIIGIILGAVLKGQELINNSKAKSLQSNLKSIETMMWSYYDRKGRWPGDCDINGIIGYTPDNAVSSTNALSTTSDPTAETCNAATPVENQNTTLAELRAARIAPYDTPNNVFASHVSDGVFQVGSVDDSAGSGEIVNAIVAYRVPSWMAKVIDVSIDGKEDGEVGRVRRWDTAVAGATWPTEAADDQMVALTYMFDRVLP